MTMLHEIGDPRPVPSLIRVADGTDGKANLSVRQVAMSTAECLTYGAVSVASGQDRERNPDLQLRKMAGLYGKWLENGGRDPTTWLALARERGTKIAGRQ